MKKQIFILSLFSLVLFLATINKSFGQNPENSFLTPTGTLFCPQANTLTCADATNGLSPVPGVEYTYTISVPAGSTVHWIVTDAANVMTAPGTLTTTIDPVPGTYLLTNPSSNYNLATNTSASITLSWASFNGTANNVLLVAYVRDASTNWCTDNIEVYRITPQYTFTLDIAGLLDTGAEGLSECVGNIKSATYDPTGTGTLNVVYDSNYVFFAINAANWQDSWMPDLSAVTDLTNGNVTSVAWAYPDQATSDAGPWNATTVQVEASHYASNVNGFIGQNGECIIVRVSVDHSNTENLIAENITLTVDGEMINPQTGLYDGAYPDLDEPTSGTDCVAVPETIIYVITSRPDIDEGSYTPFEDKDPQED